MSANPVNGGMHAVVFVHDVSKRGILAFRGTDLDTAKSSGAADACADALLFGRDNYLGYDHHSCHPYA